MNRSERPRRLDHLALDTVGLICVAFGLYQILQGARMTLNYYDEGILLSHARTLVWGGWPFRDFYTQYPPGIYFLLRGLWRIFGIQVMVGRYLSELLRIGIGALAGFVGGRLARRRFAALPAGLVMLWLGQMWTIPWAWLVAVLGALGFVIALPWALATLGRARLALAGFMLGWMLSFRHDLFIYFCCGLVALAALAMFRRRVAPRVALRAAGWLAAGAALPVAIFWLPTLVAVSWVTVYRDLYADQVRYVLPARKHPLPPMIELVSIAHLPWRLPAFLASFDQMTFGLVFAAPALGALAMWRAHRRAPLVDLATAAPLTALALAVLPQALGRSDWFHALQVILPGAVLLGALPYSFGAAGGRRSSVVTALVGAAVLAFGGRAFHDKVPPEGPLFPGVGEETHDGSPFTRGVPDAYADARRQLRQFLAAVLEPREPVFIGNRNHALLAVNEVDLYFVLNHPSATRYLQFDPGIVTREAVQREMVGDLERKKTRVAILSDGQLWTEPFNDSSKVGSTLLDDYLGAHYHQVRTIGPYEIRLRNQ